VARQKRVGKKSSASKAPQETSVEVDRSKAEALKSDMDDILDEIDSVLEENAQEFVDQYVQKGGE